jgi:hypothetical protein
MRSAYGAVGVVLQPLFPLQLDGNWNALNISRVLKMQTSQKSWIFSRYGTAKEERTAKREGSEQEGLHLLWWTNQSQEEDAEAW